MNNVDIIMIIKIKFLQFGFYASEATDMLLGEDGCTIEMLFFSIKIGST
jgi:hypothetical protein